MKMAMAALGSFALVLTSPVVRAEMIPFNYSVQNTTVYNNNNPLKTTSFEVNGAGSSSTGNVMDKLAPFILNFGSVTNAGPDTFTNVPISLSVAITDANSQGIPGAIGNGTVTFNGFVSGILAVHAHEAPWTFTWSTGQQSITLGSAGAFHTYTVTAPSFFTFPFSGPGVEIDIQASDYTPGIDPLPGTVSAAPEPTGLVLATLALPALLCARRRRVDLGRRTLLFAMNERIMISRQ